MSLSGGRSDFLVLHLTELVRMCFMAATADSDPLRLEGKTAVVQRQLLFRRNFYRPAPFRSLFAPIPNFLHVPHTGFLPPSRINFCTGTTLVQGQLLFSDKLCSGTAFVQRHFCSATTLRTAFVPWHFFSYNQVMFKDNFFHIVNFCSEASCATGQQDGLIFSRVFFVLLRYLVHEVDCFVNNG
jgi:hypothetical protein